MQSGIDTVLEATGISKHLEGADLMITDEGQGDFQTTFGKTPSGVAKAARQHGVSTVAIGGGTTDDANDVFEHGIEGRHPWQAPSDRIPASPL